MTTVGEPVGGLLRTAGSRRHGGMPWEQAYEVAAAAEALPAVRTALRRAHGRTLAASLLAPIPHPAFDTAAMDGYAVAGPGPWTVTGRVLAGGASPAGRPLAPGQAVEIATGAPVPAGAFAVVPYELALRGGQSVTAADAAGHGAEECGQGDGAGGGPGAAATSSLVRGWNIRRRGEECPAGRELLPAGTLVTPAVLG
ncbi:MAG: molybdopterin molybdotransferase, partial [Streptomyces sp.]|nr:molybdopterin molybdotransferase [Streptomyces sp.]